MKRFASFKRVDSNRDVIVNVNNISNVSVYDDFLTLRMNNGDAIDISRTDDDFDNIDTFLIYMNGTD